MIKTSLMPLALTIALALPSALKAEIGFFSKDSRAVPSQVKSRLNSIFQLKMPNYLTMSTEEAKAFLTATNLKAEGIRTIQTCLEKNEKTCTFPILEIPGTAFIDAKEDRLWTNCHLIDGWIRFSKQKLIWSGSQEKLFAFLKTQNFPARLYDSKNQRIDRPSDQFRITLAHVIDSANTEDCGCNFRDDAIQFSSSRALGKPIPWNQGDLSSQENLKTYIGGFPLPVGRKIKNHSSGATVARELFHWTRGHNQSIEQANARLRKANKDPENYNLILSGSYGIFSDNDSAAGMSGSPILNSKGEFLGIFKAVIPQDYSEKGQNDYPILSIGINVQGLTFLKYLLEP